MIADYFSSLEFSAEFWAIVVVGIALFKVNLIAADENEKRLNRIIDLLERDRR